MAGVSQGLCFQLSLCSTFERYGRPTPVRPLFRFSPCRLISSSLSLVAVASPLSFHPFPLTVDTSFLFGGRARYPLNALPPAKSQEQKWVQEGLITESLPNGMFRVRLDNEQDLILGYICGKIRKSFIRILPGDRVRVEMSRYDSTKGRIIYRLRSKGAKD